MRISEKLKLEGLMRISEKLPFKLSILTLAIVTLVSCIPKAVLWDHSIPSTAPISFDLNIEGINEDAEVLIALDYFVSAGNKATSCSTSDLSNLVETSACLCDSDGACSVSLKGSLNFNGEASFNYTVSLNTKTSNSATVKVDIVDGNLSCPVGFVAVDGNELFGTTDFCVMKYEAKCTSDCDGTTDLPVSKALDPPWVSISAYEAHDRCEAMSEGGSIGTFSLISNPEWMTIARDIELLDVNWSGGTVGSGCVFTGNTGTDDTCGYDGPTPAYGLDSSRDPKSKLYLSNGNEVWDMSGNVDSIVDWDSSSPGFTVGPLDVENAVTEFNVASLSSLRDNDYRPSNLTYTSSHGMGIWHGGGGGTALRGANYNVISQAGIYTLFLLYGPTGSWPYVGFRCVYRH